MIPRCLKKKNNGMVVLFAKIKETMKPLGLGEEYIPSMSVIAPATPESCF